MSKKKGPTRSTFETITPLTASPIKRKRADTEKLSKKHRLILLALLCFLLLLVIGGGWLLYYLSKNPIQTGEVTNIPIPVPADVKKNSPEAHQAQSIPEVETDQVAREKETAHQKLADFLVAKETLEGQGVADWGEPSYIEMIKSGEAADSAFMNKDYKVAAEQYIRATSMAEDLAGRSDEALIRMLDDREAALDAGEGVQAQSKFGTALMIDSASQVARRGLERAKTIEAVNGLIASGKQHETGGKPTLAAADYQKALQLDAYSQEARTALENVTGRIREAQFQQLISAGLAAFHGNEFPVARKKLLKAKALKPNSPEVLEALLQVDQAIRLARIDTLQKNALAAEQIEDWQSVVNLHQAVLDIDPNIQFARRGRKRAAEQIRIAKRFDFFLANPEILESDNQLKSAILLLSEAEEVEPQGPKLAKRIQKLDRRVRIAKTPIKITIVSDNLTHVAVYKIGKLGRFEVRELELRPGSYTVVGVRDGYQDVRQKIVIKPDREPIRVTVKCKVKI